MVINEKRNIFECFAYPSDKIAETLSRCVVLAKKLFAEDICAEPFFFPSGYRPNPQK